MAHVCPWWLGYFLISPLRRRSQDPAAILAPWIHEGMTVLEPGPGMGWFTLELARLAGPAGRVVAVDIQPRMLDSVKRRAAKRGLADRVETRLARPDSLGVADLASAFDFVLAFAMVHERPSAARFFVECAAALRPGGSLLLAEPKGHVKASVFAAELEAAAAAGLNVASRPEIARCHSALLRRM